MSAFEYYATVLLVYGAVDAMAVLGLNLQFGVAGVLNFGFIVFQAAGAYTAAVLTLGPAKPASQGGFQEYIGGAHLPFPLPFIAAMVVAGLLSALVGLVGLPRLRRDYQALVMLIVSIASLTIVQNYIGLFNGSNGLSLVPKPLSGLGLSTSTYNWAFVGFCVVLCAIVMVLVDRITYSPFGRNLRAVRENPEVAASMGKNVTGLRLTVFVAGGAIAGLSGALLVTFIAAWSPGSWTYAETFILFTAVIIGGKGNNRGALLGAVLVGVVFVEGVTFLPTIGYLGLTDSLQWIAIALLWLAFLWYRPRGIIPERKRVYDPS